MGLMAPGGAEQSPSVQTAALTAISTGTTQMALLEAFNFAAWGTFTGTVALQCSYDGGTTWLPVISRYTGSAITLAAAGAGRYDEVEPGVYYRIYCTAYTSGTINVRLSGGATRSSDYRLT